jgi:outer membrane protein OmpA-like peptidoglycan-associated protein
MEEDMIGILVSLALSGCAKKSEPVEQAVSRSDLPEDAGEWRYTIVDFDPSLVQNCGISTTHTYFKYDSDQLSENGKDVVTDIANCVTDGPLKGAELIVVGSTDPAGTDQYNMELGMSRAESVEKELSKNGVAKTRVTVVSLGEVKASASPDTWPKDRQVRVEVAPGTVAVKTVSSDEPGEPTTTDEKAADPSKQ